MKLILATFLFALLFASPAWAQVVISHPVEDVAGVLSPADRERIAARIVAIRAETQVQVALVVVNSTDGVPISDYAHATFTQWGGGDAVRNDGVLVVFAVRDHHSDIETGTGVQDRIPDVLARRMLDDARPALREGRYSAAFFGVVDTVGARVGSRSTMPAMRPVPAMPVAPHRDESEIVIFAIVAGLGAVAFLVWWFMRSDRRSSSSYSGGGPYRSSGYSGGGYSRPSSYGSSDTNVFLYAPSSTYTPSSSSSSSSSSSWSDSSSSSSDSSWSSSDNSGGGGSSDGGGASGDW